MNALPFPTNPAVGTRFQNWVWNGSRWVCSPGGMVVITQVFRSNATYIPSLGLVTAVAATVGGGGAGGAAGPSANALQILGGGGGGSGGHSRVTLPAALVLGGVAVVIGLGGVPTDTDVQGPSGGVTSFGAFCVANGGTGGWFNSGVAGTHWGEAGLGGSPGVGDLTFPGADGTAGPFLNLTAAQQNTYAGGHGGQVLGGARNYSWGPGQIPGGQASWANTGAGGSGAMCNQLATGAISQGGAGGSGICWVDEYCWVAPGSEGCCPDGETGQARIAWPGWRGDDC